MKHLDYLFIGAHPDDCEIFAGGTILHLLCQYKVGICDLTEGELSTYGNVKTRQDEVKTANQKMQLSWRKNLKLKDGAISNESKNIQRVVNVIRETRPKIIFTFAEACRHPDHSATHHLVKTACFFAGVKKYSISKNSQLSSNISHRLHKPQGLLFFREFYPLQKIDFVIDITPYWEKKKEVIQCYRSQVKIEENKTSLSSSSSKSLKSQTFIKSNLFWEHLETIARHSGLKINATYGESFYSLQTLKIDDPLEHYQNLL